MFIKLDQQTAQQILDYLMKQPYHEVHALIPPLFTAPKLEEEEDDDGGTDD